MKRRILFVSEGAATSPTRYRALAYFDRLRGAGWEPTHLRVVGVWRRLVLVEAARRAEVIVVLRKMFSPGFCRALRGGGRKLVLDIDDALYATDDGAASARAGQRFAATAGAVDCVWAGNEVLAYEAARHAPVVVLPTSVEMGRYAGEGAGARAGEGFDVAWIGSSSTRKYLEEALPRLAEARRAIADLRLKIVADFDLPAARELGLPTVPVAWSSETEAAALGSAAVGIAPLPDNVWTRGKCGLKIVQYMAAGLPVVASPVGVQSAMVVDRYSGFLAGGAGEWVEALRRLREDAGLRVRMGNAGRVRAGEQYSVEATFGKMLASLEKLGGAG